MLGQCLKPEAQQLFTQGLDRLEQLAADTHQKGFLKLEEEQQTDALQQIAKEDYNHELIPPPPLNVF